MSDSVPLLELRDLVKRYGGPAATNHHPSLRVFGAEIGAMIERFQRFGEKA